MIALLLKDILVDFQIDIGADVIVITQLSTKGFGSPPLLSANADVKSPSSCSLSVKGYFRTSLLKNNYNLKVEHGISVIDKLEKYLF